MSFFVLGVRIICALVLALQVAPVKADAVNLQIVGTGDGIDLLRALCTDFKQMSGSIQIEIPPSIGSGGGIAAIGEGKAVLGRVARKLSDQKSSLALSTSRLRVCHQLFSSIRALV